MQRDTKEKRRIETKERDTWLTELRHETSNDLTHTRERQQMMLLQSDRNFQLLLH